MISLSSFCSDKSSTEASTFTFIMGGSLGTRWLQLDLSSCGIWLNRPTEIGFENYSFALEALPFGGFG